MDSEEYYKQKYLKYKMKYLALKGAGYKQNEQDKYKLLSDERQKIKKMNNLKEEIGVYLDNAVDNNQVLVYPYKKTHILYSSYENINTSSTGINKNKPNELSKLKISRYHYNFPVTANIDAINDYLYYIGVIYSQIDKDSDDCDDLINKLKLNDFQYQITGTANVADNNIMSVTLHREVEEEISAKITNIQSFNSRTVNGKNVYFYTAKLGENLTTVKTKLSTADVDNQKIVVLVSATREQIINYLMNHIDASEETTKTQLNNGKECDYDGILGITIIPGNVLKYLYQTYYSFNR
jgi:hypothetical protein